MSDGINGSESKRTEYREREIHGGSTRRELFDDAQRLRQSGDITVTPLTGRALRDYNKIIADRAERGQL